MTLLYTNKEAFTKVKNYLERNQYDFSYEIQNGQYYIKISY